MKKTSYGKSHSSVRKARLSVLRGIRKITPAQLHHLDMSQSQQILGSDTYSIPLWSKLGSWDEYGTDV